MQTRQAHPVPKTVSRPASIFAPEIHARPQIITDYEPEEDHSPPGATCQNLFRPEMLYQCRVCGTQVVESDVRSHVCREGVNENEYIPDADEGRDRPDAESNA